MYKEENLVNTFYTFIYLLINKGSTKEIISNKLSKDIGFL